MHGGRGVCTASVRPSGGRGHPAEARAFRRVPEGCTAPTGSLPVERLFVQRDRTGWQVRVLGVDPGLTRCGLGVVDGGAYGGREVRYVAVDVVRTPADAPLATRLLAV